MKTTDTSKNRSVDELFELHQRISELEKKEKDYQHIAEKLKKSEQHYRRIFEQSIDGIIIISDGRIVRANQAACMLSGLTADEIIGQNPIELIHPDHRAMAEQRIQALFRREDLHVTFEYKVLRTDGSELWVETRSKPFDLDGKAAIKTFIRDVTEQKRIEKALRDSEEKYRLLVKNVPALICKGFIDWSVEFVDNKIEQLTGYPMEVFFARKMKWSELIVEEDLESARQKFIEALKTDKSYIREYRIRSKDQKIIWIQERGQIICDQNGKIEYVSAVFFDISARKQAEEEKQQLEIQLRYAQKMEAVGTLAGGVAHDFNNLLQAIQGYAELLLLDKQEGDPGHKKLNEIVRIAQRGSDLTRQMLTFSRKVESHKQPLNLNLVIENIQHLLTRTIPKMIAIELHLDHDLKTINADPVQMEQVIMNLCFNARDVMIEGGKLTINTQNIFLDESFCKAHMDAKPGEYVRLSISDTGSGIDKEAMEHIFEPFYTSKEVGKGTGLGLAMVYGIVQSHNGIIACNSEPKKGSTFHLYLPALPAKAKSRPSQDADKFVGGGRETVLLADDEQFLLDLGKQFLEKYGYTVFTATDGESAIELYRAKKEDIDLIILDLIMPGMGGGKCLEHLLKLDPHVKVIISSGYSSNKSMVDYVEAGAKGFINKPYKFEKLLKTVRDVLDQDGKK